MHDPLIAWRLAGAVGSAGDHTVANTTTAVVKPTPLTDYDFVFGVWGLSRNAGSPICGGGSTPPPSAILLLALFDPQADPGVMTLGTEVIYSEFQQGRNWVFSPQQQSLCEGDV